MYYKIVIFINIFIVALLVYFIYRVYTLKNSAYISLKQKYQQEISNLREQSEQLQNLITSQQIQLSSYDKQIEQLDAINNNIIHKQTILDDLTKQLSIADEQLHQLQLSSTAISAQQEERLLNSKQMIDTNLQMYYDKRLETYQINLRDIISTLKGNAQQEFTILESDCQNKLNEIDRSIKDKQEQLRDLTSTVTAINNDLALRQKETAEKDLYRLVLSDRAKADINYCLSITDKISNPELLYKFIWTEHIQKAFQLMIKRSMPTTEPKNVIYLIRHIDSDKIYIGKTKGKVADRWSEHLKTSLNIGTVARCELHQALYAHWDEFTFEVLERVSDNGDLGEREKYWINFYQSNKYGFNMKVG